MRISGKKELMRNYYLLIVFLLINLSNFASTALTANEEQGYFDDWQRAVMYPDRVIVLDLDGKGLNYLPAEISNLYMMQELKLSNNNLTSLPESFGKLQNLRALDLKENPIQRLPESFSQLISLEVLYINKQLSEDWFADKEIHNNILGEVAELRQLTYLNIGNMGLSEFPPSLQNMKNLEELYAYNNNFKQIPESIGSLKKLRILELSNNKLTSLPGAISQCTNLEGLNLNGNDLTSLPDISALNKLKYLNLSTNPFANPNREIEKITSFTQLTNLNISNINITALPENFGNYPDLKTLDLSYNQLSMLPSSINQMVSLQKLNLTRNRISDFAFDLSGLESLTNLDLSHNNLSYLGDNIAGMSKLNVLDLGFNQNLREISTEIQKLDNLRFIVLKQVGMNEGEISDLQWYMLKTQVML